MTSNVPRNLEQLWLSSRNVPAVLELIRKYGEIDSDELHTLAKQEGIGAPHNAVKLLLKLGKIHQRLVPGKGAKKKYVFGPLPKSPELRRTK